jgi:hypothetical protein
MMRKTTTVKNRGCVTDFFHRVRAASLNDLVVKILGLRSTMKNACGVFHHAPAGFIVVTEWVGISHFATVFAGFSHECRISTPHLANEVTVIGQFNRHSCEFGCKDLSVQIWCSRTVATPERCYLAN